jgi:filamentous hemagglutinin family protein
MARYSFRKAIKVIGVGVLGAIGAAMGGGAIAQNTIVPDSTLGAESSIVVPSGFGVDYVLGGAERENNLFHSFEQFDIGSATSALFLFESNQVDNIFARVTAQNASDIFGVLGIRQLVGGNFLNTPANLYLINPSGIVFGENAVLDIGGSFTATTADSIVFSDGSIFDDTSSTSLPNAFTINPSVYLFSGQNAGEIKVGSDRIGLNGIDQGLSVPIRENLNLIGGNILVNGLGSSFRAGLSARGGRVNVVAVREGRVNVLGNGTLLSSQDNINGDISLSDRAVIETAFDNGGDILLTGQNVLISGASVIRTGILRGVGSQNSQAGNILIEANTLTLQDGAQIDASINGTGRAGNVGIDAQKVTLTGFRVEGADTANPREISSAIRSTVQSSSVGNGGDIRIRAPEVEIFGGAGIAVSTLGRGNAGNVSIITDSFSLSGTTRNRIEPSSIQSTVESSAVGNGGSVTVSATDSILVQDGAGITASAFGLGSAGLVNLFSENTIVFRGTDRRGFGSTIDVRRGGNAISNSTDVNAEKQSAITVTANNELRLENGAQLITSTASSADSGNVSITAPNITIRGAATISNLERFPSGVLSTADTGSSGRAGDLTVNASSLTIEEGGALTSRSLGEGLAGNIILNAADQIFVSDGDIDTISTQTSGGDVIIQTRALTLERDGDITTRAADGRGAGGGIDITATESVVALGDSDIIASSSGGQGGRISLKTPGFFGENFTISSLEANPEELDRNNRVDINARGITNGAVDIPDVSFLENSLSSLPDTLIVPDQLIANSCIARTQEGQGTLVTTGGGGSAITPSLELTAHLSTGTVQITPSSHTTSSEDQSSDTDISIEEPTGIYRLADGRLVMGQVCL